MGATEEDLALLRKLEERMDRIEEMIREEQEFQKFQSQLIRDTKRTVNYFEGERNRIKSLYDEKIGKIDHNISIIHSNTEKMSKAEKIEDVPNLIYPDLK